MKANQIEPTQSLTNSNLIGWFAIALSKEIKRNTQLTGMLSGRPFVLTRLANNQLLFNNEVKGILEQNDFIFAWHHPGKHSPTWHVPELNQNTWTHFLHHRLTVRTHPQEVYENCVDVTHFGFVHDFSEIMIDQAPQFQDHNMWVRHFIQRKNPNPFRTKPIVANFEVRLHGLGCAHTHISVPALGMNVRMFTLATPTNIGWVDIRIAVAIAMKKNHFLKRIFNPLIHRSIYKNIIHDFCQDLFIWENKCYRPRPLLVKGDGQIMKFRRWCQQFYT